MPSLTRRGLLIGSAAALALTACRDKASRPRIPTAEERARAAAAAAEQSLVDEYGTVLAAHPELGQRLAPLGDHHRRHVAVLVPAPSPSPTVTSAAITTTPAAPLPHLARLEQRLAATHTAALGAVSPSLALLLASLAASAAANAAELGRRA